MPSIDVHISCTGCTGCTCPSVRCQNRWSISLALWFCPIERGPWLESCWVEADVGSSWTDELSTNLWSNHCTGLAHSSAFGSLSQFAKHLDIEAGVGLSWSVELSSELRSAICPPAFHFPRFVELHCIRRSSDQPFTLFSIFLYQSISELNPSPPREGLQILASSRVGPNQHSHLLPRAQERCALRINF